MKRRNFVKLLSMGASGLIIPSFSRQGWSEPWQNPAKSNDALNYDYAPTLPKYVDPLPIPTALKPLKKTANGREYKVRMVQFQQRLHSQLAPTTVWGYEGQYPGPVIEAEANEPVTIEWANQLPEKHILPIDTKVHGAEPSNPAVRTVTHLHGARTLSKDDGLPENWVPSGQTLT
ncbi:MAG TPA: multicopper oxidase domain-containing protein, partial [Candidatus Angelobacter sp.]|nr:multicopper oxidase domain-containing protein [Candidatus Angelobacter sp.]